MKKKRFVLGSLLCACVVLVATCQWWSHIRCNQMLRAVGLQEMSGLTKTDHVYWRDWLQYADGYEIAVFAVDEAQWNTPETWTREIDAVYVNDLADQLGVDIHSDAIFDLSLGGLEGSSWIFVDNRADRPFDQQDFYLAYLDDTYHQSKLVFIYRGHHLYGV